LPGTPAVLRPVDVGNGIAGMTPRRATILVLWLRLLLWLYKMCVMGRAHLRGNFEFSVEIK